MYLLPSRTLLSSPNSCLTINSIRRRNVVERSVNRLEGWRGIATRYEKRAVNYRTMVVIAALMIWLTSRVKLSSS